MAASAVRTKAEPASLAPALTAADRAAAARLGDLYLRLDARRALPLNSQAVPKPGRVLQDPHMTDALFKIHGSDSERERRARTPSDYRSVSKLYATDYNALVPKLWDATRAWTVVALVAEELALGQLRLK